MALAAHSSDQIRNKAKILSKSEVEHLKCTRDLIGNVHIIATLSSSKSMKTEAVCLIETDSALVLRKHIWKHPSLRIDWDLQKYTIIPHEV